MPPAVIIGILPANRAFKAARQRSGQGTHREDGCAVKSAPLAEFAGIIKSDIALWAKVVKDAGIPAD